jgi:hypothetical protein
MADLNNIFILLNVPFCQDECVVCMSMLLSVCLCLYPFCMFLSVLYHYFEQLLSIKVEAS